MNLDKIVITICLFFLFSCKEDDNSNTDYGTPLNTISFNFDKDKKESIDYLNLIDSIKVVKLETNENCLIGSISKIIYDQNYIYILDEISSKALLKYDQSGKFIQKISNVGNGPGEYVRLTDFFLLNDEVVLLDGYSSKIMFFSKTGQFLSEFSVKTVAEKFGIIDNSHFCMLNESKTSFFSDYNIMVIDSLGNTVKKLMKIPSYSKDKNLSLYKPTDYYLGNELLYTDIFNNNIFIIGKDAISIKYHFDFGKYTLDKAFLNTNKKLTASDLLLILNKKKDIVNSIDFFNENDKYIFFQCLKKGNIFQIFYNKVEKTKYIFDYNSFPEWLKYISRPFIHSGYNTFSTTFNSYSIEDFKHQHSKNISKNAIYSKLNSVIEKTKESDNPIIITYYLK